MDQYLECLKHVIKNGKDRSDRTGVGTRSIFGYQMRFDLTEGFPAVTTKRLAWKSVVSELLWMLRGSTDERELAEITFEKPREELVNKRTIWTANADDQAKKLGYVNTDLIKDLGPVYGHQWRSWDAKIGYVDQIADLLDNMHYDPGSRRHIVSAWNADQINVMALPPCHVLFQFYIHDNTLSCQLYQRSADLPLGSPFNIASYSLLTHMVAQLLGLNVGEFIYTLGDAHVYQNQIETAKQQIQREPMPLPTLKMPEFNTLAELVSTKASQYNLINYNHHPDLSYPFAV